MEKDQKQTSKGLSIEKIPRVSVTEQVYSVLVEKITGGEWKPGEKIPSEIELSEKLGVSRVSLKMALQKLNIMGLTETRVGEGTFVRKFDMSTYLSELFQSNILSLGPKELNEFRSLLEFNVMYLAILHTDEDPEALHELEVLLDGMQKSLETEQTEDYHRFHFQFHQRICEMSGNQMFIQLYTAVNGSFFEIYKRNSERTWGVLGVEESIHFHQRILKALKEKDIAACLQVQGELVQDRLLQQ